MVTYSPHASAARFHALRLLHGEEVFSRLHDFIQQHQLHAARIAGCTGSLAHVALRFAGQEETTLLTGTGNYLPERHAGTDRRAPASCGF